MSSIRRIKNYTNVRAFEDTKRVDTVELRLLRWCLYTGGGNLPSETGRDVKIKDSITIFICATVLLGCMVTLDIYNVLDFTKHCPVLQKALIVLPAATRYLHAVLLLLSARKRVRAVTACLATLQELDTCYGKIEAKGLSAYRTHLLVLLTLVANTALYFGQMTLTNTIGSRLVFQFAMPVTLAESILMEHEVVLNILVHKLGTRVQRHSSLGDGCDPEDVERRLWLGCRLQRLVRRHGRELYTGHLSFLVILLVRFASDLILTFYVFIGTANNGSVLSIMGHVPHLLIHLCKFMVVAEPSDQLNYVCQRNLEDLTALLSRSVSLLPPAVYRELRHCLSLLGIASSTPYVGGLLSFRRAVLLPIASFASTYVIVIVQIHQGSI